MTGPREERDLRLGWSLWRRVHQAVAKRCHAVKRDPLRQRPAAGERSASATTAIPPPAEIPSRLTDVQWARIEALLPRSGGHGRSWRDHRTVIDGILWVHTSGASWRDLPEEEFGVRQTTYYRYNRWRKEGLWQRITQLLQC